MKIFSPQKLGLGVRFLSTGAYLPAEAVSNAQLVSAGAPLTDEEMVKLSGIRSRHRAAPHQAASDLAIAAGHEILRRAQVPPDSVDRLIIATVSSDHSTPSTACLVQTGLGLRTVPAYDVTASCTGFLYALDSATRAVATGDDHVLAIASEVRTRFLNIKDRSTCALFGDGAAGALLGRCEPGRGILGIGLLADGTGARSVFVPAGGSREPASQITVANSRHAISMDEGPQVYLSAVEGMLGTAELLLEGLNLRWDDIDLVVPHQPNRRILERMAKLAKLPSEKLVIDIETTGNMSSATCAVALDTALRQGRAKQGMKVLLLAAGAGYTAGGCVFEVDPELARASAL